MTMTLFRQNSSVSLEEEFADWFGKISSQLTH